MWPKMMKIYVKKSMIIKHWFLCPWSNLIISDFKSNLDKKVMKSGKWILLPLVEVAIPHKITVSKQTLTCLKHRCWSLHLILRKNPVSTWWCVEMRTGGMQTLMLPFFTWIIIANRISKSDLRTFSQYYVQEVYMQAFYKTLKSSVCSKTFLLVETLCTSEEILWVANWISVWVSFYFQIQNETTIKSIKASRRLFSTLRRKCIQQDKILFSWDYGFIVFHLPVRLAATEVVLAPRWFVHRLL